MDNNPNIYNENAVPAADYAPVEQPAVQESVPQGVSPQQANPAPAMAQPVIQQTAPVQPQQAGGFMPPQYFQGYAPVGYNAQPQQPVPHLQEQRTHCYPMPRLRT